MTGARPDSHRTAASTTPPETLRFTDEPNRAAQAAVRACRETRIGEKYGSYEKAVDFVLNLPGWRAIEDRLAAAGCEDFSVIRRALAPNGWFVGDNTTPADVFDGLGHALRSAVRPALWARRHD